VGGGKEGRGKKEKKGGEKIEEGRIGSGGEKSIVTIYSKFYHHVGRWKWRKKGKKRKEKA